ncbi:hypothetical protein BD779DRAFT_846564 [Infundibulicybe gibba]|nr:hypothetical protein BD779DRAFT_846564 [Infundibulicybe gibba]
MTGPMKPRPGLKPRMAPCPQRMRQLSGAAADQRAARTRSLVQPPHQRPALPPRRQHLLARSESAGVHQRRGRKIPGTNHLEKSVGAPRKTPNPRPAMVQQAAVTGQKKARRRNEGDPRRPLEPIALIAP